MLTAFMYDKETVLVPIEPVAGDQRRGPDSYLGINPHYLNSDGSIRYPLPFGRDTDCSEVFHFLWGTLRLLGQTIIQNNSFGDFIGEALDTSYWEHDSSSARNYHNVARRVTDCIKKYRVIIEYRKRGLASEPLIESKEPGLIV